MTLIFLYIYFFMYMLFRSLTERQRELMEEFAKAENGEEDEKQVAAVGQ